MFVVLVRFGLGLSNLVQFDLVQFDLVQFGLASFMLIRFVLAIRIICFIF